MLIERTILTSIQTSLKGEPWVNILYGPRQSGKTTLLRLINSHSQIPTVFYSGDDLRTHDLFKPRLDTLRKTAGNNKLIIIDEAQRIENIGLSLKLLFDNLHIRILASGSASFDLANKINEPLTGRTRTFFLYPLSLPELPMTAPQISPQENLEDYLRFGLYPKVITTKGTRDKERYLSELINTYLYKDILTFGDVRKPKKVVDLLSLLALQIGSEVAISVLAQNLALSKPIVEKYLDLLEKMFIIVNLRGFSRNLRKEISKTSKYYFLDPGLRNACIRNFNPLTLRNDSGALFENFCIIERQKRLSNLGKPANFYFWRTYDQKEIDLIEERSGKLRGWEFKWGTKQRSKTSFRTFTASYPGTILKQIGPDNIGQII
jgi:uncharacterized protein